MKTLTFSQPTELTESLVINEPTVLYCINGGYLKFLSYGRNIPAIICNASCTFINFNLFGGGKELKDDQEADGLQSGVKFQNPSGVFQFIGGRIEGFNWGGIWAFDCKLAIVSGATIIGTGSSYYNYGAWQGGRGNAYGQDLYFLNNTVSNVRHAVGASGHPNSYYAYGNTVDSLKHAFDRHSRNTNGFGGLNTHIIGNTINPDRYLFSVNEPYGTILTSGNTSRGEKPIGEICGNPVNLGYETESITIG